jgi:signal transduction histidine kinase/ligand-binding sensor domain-containing protein
MRKIPIAFIVLLLNVPSSFAQTIGNFRKYTSFEGLSGNQVTSLLQDDRGLLWVGTTNGLDWFDGTRFYQPPIRPRSGELFISHIVQDSHNDIWITTYYNGIYKFANNRFENFLPDTLHVESGDNNVMDLLEYRPGHYLCATSHHLYTYTDHRFTVFDTALDNQKILIDKLTLLDGNNLLAVPAFGKGIYWYRFLPDGSFESKKLFGKDLVHGVYIDGKDIWVSAGSGLSLFHSIQDLADLRASEHYKPDDTPGNVIHKDAAGILWFTNKVLYTLHNKQVQVCRQNGRKPVTDINAILTDFNQNTWLGTHDGLIRINRSNYSCTNLTQAGASSTIISAQKDGSNTLWCGTFDGFLYKDGSPWRYLKKVNGQPIGFVHSLKKDSAGRIWAGTNAGLLQVKHGQAELVSKRIFISLYQDESHGIWCGDTAGNIFHLHNKDLTIAVTKPQVKDLVSAIFLDHLGYLWIGYYSYGLVKYEWTGNHWQAIQDFSTETGYENCRIRSLCDDGHGNLLAGTRTRGYFIFPLKKGINKTVRNITRESNGLSGNWIKKILVDRQGQVMLVNSRGVDVLSGSADNPIVARMYFSDGENVLEPYSLDLIDTTFLVGSTNSLITFDPGFGAGVHQLPKVYFTKVNINGKADSSFVPYAAGNGTIQLNYHQNNLSFEFCSVNFDAENNAYYKYMLEGIDKTWSGPVSGTSLNYSNLPSGTYTMKIIAQNEAGLWGNDPATISFTIAIPFWRQGWFIVLVSIALLCIAFLAYRYRLRQLLAMERLRTKIATDLHDDISSTLSSITILSNIALKENNSIENMEMMEEIRNSSSLLMEKMDDIVWSIDPKNDTLEDLMSRLKHFASKLFEAKDILYDIRIEETVKEMKLPMIFRQHIYLILKEAVNNLVKYSRCREARIEIWADSGHLHARVSDDGIGFDKNAGSEGNGLLNMKNRASWMEAGFEISSAPGKGSAVSLSVKIK